MLKPRDDISKKDIETEYNVVIIGAGISGLEAAHQLDRKGVKPIMILEGRDRIGGRIWTEKIGDTPIDLGASWIHGLDEGSPSPNPLYLITQRNNIETSKTTQTTTIYDNIGKKIADDSYDLFSSYELFAEKYSESLTDEQKEKLSIQEMIDKFSIANNLNAEKRKMLEYTMQWYVGMEQAENTTNISFAKSLETQYYNEDEDNEVIFPNGYDQIINCLSPKSENVIHANVTEVDYSNIPIKIKTNRGDFTAKYVISTLPIPILQNKTSIGVKFTPEFEQKKKDAINSILMGTMNKVYLLYEKSFWGSSSWINSISDNSHDKNWQFFFNLYKYDNKPILLAFSVGESAKKIEKKSDLEIKNEVVEAIRKIYPDSPDPIEIKITRWSSDPLAGGSYSTLFRTGNTVNAANILAEPIDKKLFFAGEATNPYYYGTVHGAFVSGYRAAEEIIKISNQTTLDSPLEQIRHGIKKVDVICNEGSESLLDTSVEAGVRCKEIDMNIILP